MKTKLLIAIVAALSSLASHGQTLRWSNSSVISRLDATDTSALGFQIGQNVDYNLVFTNILYANWSQSDHSDFISFSHLLKYKNQFSGKRRIRVSNLFSHELGIQYYFDSISRFHPDETTLDTRMDFALGKNFSFILNSIISTRLFNAWLYTKGPYGGTTRNMTAGFLTPFILTLSAGLGFQIPRTGNLTLGLSSARLTVLCNNQIRKQNPSGEVFGVPAGKNHRFEYGLSLRLTIDRDLIRNFHWNFDLLAFQEYLKPAGLSLKNLLAVRIGRYFRASLQTRLIYEEKISRHLQLENMISGGLYFAL